MIPDPAARPLVAFVAAALSSLLGCQTGQPGGSGFEEAPAIAQLEFRSGTITLERSQKRSFAELGYVLSNDRFETGAGSTMQLRFPSGSTVEVGPDAQLVVAEDKAGSAVKASHGNYLARTRRADSAREVSERPRLLTVQTPFGFARCEPESEISVQVTPDSARVQIHSGKVEVGSKAGSSMTGSAGDQFLLSATAFERVPLAPQNAAEQQRGAAAPQVRSLAVDGQALIRRRDSQRWIRLGLRGEKLAEHDILRVSDGAWGLDWGSGGGRLIASGGAELSLEKSEGGTDASEPSVNLLKGEVALVVEKQSPARILISGIHLATQAPGYFSIAKTTDGLELTALAGDLGFKKEGVEGRVLAGQMATVHGSEKAILEDLDRADLTLPPRFGFKVFHQGLDWVALSWEGGRRDFSVEVASDSQFSQTVLRGVVHRSFVNVPAPSHAALFWRVLDQDGKLTLARGSAAFSAEAQSRDVARARNEAPESSNKSTTYSEDTSETSVGTLVVRSPKNGETVKGNRIQAVGMVPVGARVLVNGKPALLDERNRFDVTVVPVGRPPLAIFRMLRPNEPEVIIVRMLRR